MLKWIKALGLDMWAETVQVGNKMPELVADLIWATSTGVRYLRLRTKALWGEGSSIECNVREVQHELKAQSSKLKAR